MSVFSKIRGTIETLFQLGIGGPNLKNNAGVIEARNAGDAAFVVVRGLDPVAANDLATKNYADTGAQGGVVREVRFTTALINVSSATVLPANAVVTKVQFEVTTPYSGGGTVKIGQTGTPNLLMDTGDSNPQAAGIYEKSDDLAWGAAPLAVLVTIGGAPAAGAGVVIVHYISAPAA